MAVFYLRTKEGTNLIEASEIKSEGDFSTAVYARNLCKYVVEWDVQRVGAEQRDKFIQDIDDLSELRGEFFETDACKKESTWDFLLRRFGEVAKTWGLCVVTD